MLHVDPDPPLLQGQETCLRPIKAVAVVAPQTRACLAVFPVQSQAEHGCCLQAA